MKGKKLGELSLLGLLLLQNSGLVGQHRTHIRTEGLHILCDEDSCSWVSSHNASKHSVSESTGSSGSGEGLGEAAP